MKKEIIRINNLSYKVKDGNEEKMLLNNISISFEMPEIITISGPSGSGKTTFLYAISGMLDNLKGEIYIEEKNILACTKKEREKIAYELLTEFGIDDLEKKHVSQMSGGEQQRIAIMRAIINKPQILLADEPTGNLDTSTSHDVIGLLKILSRQYQQTLIVITHDNDIAQMADRIVQIEDGKISTKGSDFHVSE